MPIQVLDSNTARTRWRDIVDTASSGSADVVVERYGKPVVAVIAYQDFLSLQDELDDLRAARRAAEAYQVWKEQPGRGRPWEEVEAELVAEGLLDASG
ncbi:MAG: type II toxin-antitoxin system Phd/YefM family antitoxin [Anaerolineales bacterium]|nr:type II toxin-antitoxin system Phd/YefM family antitoxin [Anaerolineales bacterium]